MKCKIDNSGKSVTYKIKPMRKTCPVCGGSGKLSTEILCSFCNGLGWLLLESETKTKSKPKGKVKKEKVVATARIVLTRQTKGWLAAVDPVTWTGAKTYAFTSIKQVIKFLNKKVK